jgi:hypothetical protein
METVSLLSLPAFFCNKERNRGSSFVGGSAPLRPGALEHDGETSAPGWAWPLGRHKEYAAQLHGRPDAAQEPEVPGAAADIDAARIGAHAASAETGAVRPLPSLTGTEAAAAATAAASMHYGQGVYQCIMEGIV